MSNNIFDKSKLTIIAGPCAIESEEMVLNIVKRLAFLADYWDFSLVFKASYDKANRSSIESFRGLGIKKGLKILNKVKKTMKVPITTDVHCINEVNHVSKVVDIIQIPAFLSRQTDLLVAAGKTGKPVNIKKGQFMAPSDIIYATDKIRSTGNNNILITERGTSFGYNTLVSDFRSIPIMKKAGYPVIFDATHSVQQPGKYGRKSGGERQFVNMLSKCAIVAGCDAVFLEVHHNPDSALCDGPNMLSLIQFENLIKELIPLWKLQNDAS